MHAKRKVIPIVLVLAIVAAATATALSRTRARDRSGLLGSGTVEATETQVSARIAGRIARVLAHEGDAVQPGDLIAELDYRDLDAEVQRAEGALQSTRALLQELENGSREEQIAAARARVRQADAALDGAHEQLEIAQQAYDSSTELKQQVDAAEAQLATAEAAAEAARARRDEAVHGPREQEVRRARAQLSGAQAALDGARQAHSDAQDLRTLVDSMRGPVVEATTARDTARESVAIAEAQESLVREGARAEQIAQADAGLDAANATLAAAKSRYQRMKDLRADDAVTQQEFEEAESVFRAAEAKARAAEESLREVRAGAREQELRAAELTTRRARAALGGADESVSEADKALAQQRLAAQQATHSADSQVGTSSAGMDAASATVDLMEAGTRPEQVAQAEAAVRQAEASVAGAQSALENARKAFGDRLEAAQRLRAAQTQLEVASAQRDAAEADLALVEAGCTEEAIESARGQVKQTEAATERATIAREDAEIRAPVAGTISDVIADEGEVITQGATVVTMVGLQDMWLKVYVPVRSLDKVRIGNAATVTADATPERSFPGEVLAIAPEAEFTPKNVQTVDQRVQEVFWVKVGVGDGGGVLKPGMPADAHFE